MTAGDQRRNGDDLLAASDCLQQRLVDEADYLRSIGVLFGEGLRDDEAVSLERELQFTLPPELRFFLSLGVPTSHGFPDWRGSLEALKRDFQWPLEGMLFDVENNGYWRPEWGQRPSTQNARTSVVAEFIRSAPPLVPVTFHCFLPNEPFAPGNPVFSVYQTDIIHMGADLASCLMYMYHDEFDEFDWPVFDERFRETRVWTTLARENYEQRRPFSFRVSK